MRYSEIKHLADKYRKHQTPSEKKLWALIRRKQIRGRKFLRQHVIVYESRNNHHFFFIPDFYCSKEKLIIELDGNIHEFRKEKDQHRDEILMSIGYRILRIQNEELINPEDVVAKIESMLHDSPSY